MWTLETQIYELILRASVVFFFLFIILRIWGKKHFSEMAPIDLLLLLIISEAVQNSLVGDEKSITGGLITVATLIILNTVLNKLTFRSKKAEKVLEGVPRALVQNGVINKKNIKKEQLTESELYEALREHGVYRVEDVGLAVMENDGKISVIRREDMH